MKKIWTLRYETDSTRKVDFSKNSTNPKNTAQKIRIRVLELDIRDYIFNLFITIFSYCWPHEVCWRQFCCQMEILTSESHHLCRTQSWQNHQMAKRIWTQGQWSKNRSVFILDLGGKTIKDPSEEGVSSMGLDFLIQHLSYNRQNLIDFK